MEAAWRIRNYFSDLSDDTLSALRLFHVELLRFNQKLNLISNFTEKNSDILHFYDSIKASEFILKDNPNLKEIYDFGSGNGLPGIVAAILYPDLKVNVVEGDDRNSEFLRHIVARIELKNVFVMNMKAEDVVIDGPVTLVSRAFANLARTLLLGNKILSKDSKIYTLKGGDWFTELTALPSPISSTWNTEMAFEYELPEGQGSRVVIRSIKKN